MIEVTLPANTGGPFSKPIGGACLRARMKAVTMTTIAPTRSSKDAIRPIAGIFSLIIIVILCRFEGLADYIISGGSVRERSGERLNDRLWMRLVGKRGTR